MRRRLIINADDLGLTEGVNRAIFEAHNRGIVTSATLMASASAFEHAVCMGKQAPQLSIGCHVLLVDGRPVLSPGDVTSLVAHGGKSFRNGIGEFAISALRGRLDAQQVESEATAQFRKLQQAGIFVTHFDTHKHTHIFPGVLRALLRAARACGIRAVRNPFAPVRPVAYAHLLGRPRLWKSYSEVRLLRTLVARFRREVHEAGLITTDGTFGILGTGTLDTKLFNAIIGCIPEGTWEFVCHPGYNDADLDRVRTRLRASRVKELEVLTSAAAREALSRPGIELISYRELVNEQVAIGN